MLLVELKLSVSSNGGGTDVGVETVAGEGGVGIGGHQLTRARTSTLRLAALTNSSAGRTLV